jgi:response regulator RpfG family c-di-GMP phosphodiesterase
MEKMRTLSSCQGKIGVLVQRSREGQAELIKIRPNIPILLCTGFSNSMSEEKAASLGIKGFLLKPIMRKDFTKKTHEVLGKTPAWS